MNLQDALAYISGHLLAAGNEIAADALIAYADEDHEGGRRTGFDDWSIDPDEGKLLYALVRTLKPAKLLEIGVREGASTAHLLAALTANGDGELFSYDIATKSLTLDSPILHFEQEDALVANLPVADFIFEDSQHSLDYSLALYDRLRALKPRIVIVHDYAMTEAHGDFHVKEAFDTLFPEGFPITLDGCERGLAVWVNPEWQGRRWEFGDGAIVETAVDPTHEYSEIKDYEISVEPVVDKPKRATRTIKSRAKRTPKATK